MRGLEEGGRGVEPLEGFRAEDDYGGPLCGDVTDVR